MFQQRIENASAGGTRSSHPLIFQDQEHFIFRRNLFPRAFPRKLVEGSKDEISSGDVPSI